MQNAKSLEKTLILGNIESRRIRGQQKMKWLDGIIVSGTWVYANSWRLWRTGKPGTLQYIDLHTDKWLNGNQMWRGDGKLKFCTLKINRMFFRVVLGLPKKIRENIENSHTHTHTHTHTRTHIYMCMCICVCVYTHIYSIYIYIYTVSLPHTQFLS